MRKFFKLFTVLILIMHAWAVSAEKRSHGVSLYGSQDLKYKENEPYAFANPKAPKGGMLRLSTIGEFTKLNPFSLKGTSAPGVSILVFETLMDSSMDSAEPFSQYGRIAEQVEIADDRLSITYYLNKKAHFTKGIKKENGEWEYEDFPLTADDVVFSFNLIKDPEFHPFYRNYYIHVEKVEKIDKHTVKFYFDKLNQELPMIMGQLSILPKKIYGQEGKDFGKNFDKLAIGSGPYIVDSYDKGSHITFRKNPNYWGGDIPVNIGRYNFDKIIYRVFLDPRMRKEAVKTIDASQRIDVLQVNSSKDWATAFNGPFVDKHWLVKKRFKHDRVSSMQCFAFNLRKDIFQDIRVRKAIASVFNFKYMNKELFYEQYTRQISYWDNNKEMWSRGPAEGAIKEKLLKLRKKYNDYEKNKIYVPKDAILRGPYNLDSDVFGKAMDFQDRVLAARSYLDEIGWIYDSELKARKKGDDILKFEILLYSPGWKRLVVPIVEWFEQIGIKATYRLVQPAEYSKMVKSFEYDIIINTFGSSQSPGNELIDAWTTKSASMPGSSNICGVQNPALDEVIDNIVASHSRDILVENVKILDRILSANHYVIPQWYISADRAVYWNRIAGPKQYAKKSDFITNVINWWWYDKKRSNRLDRAIKDNILFKDN